MTRLPCAVICVLLFVVPVARAEDSVIKEVEAQIKVLNDAFKDGGDASKLKTLMSEDHLAFTPWGGTQTREQQIQTLAELKLSVYEPGPLRIVPLGKDGAVVTYTLKPKGTFRGKAVPTNSLVSAVWVRRDGKWLELHYQETAR